MTGLKTLWIVWSFYAAKNVFYLPETARWTYIKENAKQPNVASIVDKALSDIEKENKPLRGALPNNYYSSLGIEAEKLGSLLDKVDGFDTILESADGNDIIGRVYEYFLSKFAIKKEKVRGEFYTPKIDSQSDCRNDLNPMKVNLRPLLRFGRYVCAVDEVCGEPSWQSPQGVGVWTGIYQDHF